MADLYSNTDDGKINGDNGASWAAARDDTTGAAAYAGLT